MITEQQLSWWQVGKQFARTSYQSVKTLTVGTLHFLSSNYFKFLILSSRFVQAEITSENNKATLITYDSESPLINEALLKFVQTNNLEPSAELEPKSLSTPLTVEEVCDTPSLALGVSVGDLQALAKYIETGKVAEFKQKLASMYPNDKDIIQQIRYGSVSQFSHTLDMLNELKEAVNTDDSLTTIQAERDELNEILLQTDGQLILRFLEKMNSIEEHGEQYYQAHYETIHKPDATPISWVLAQQAARASDNNQSNTIPATITLIGVAGMTLFACRKKQQQKRNPKQQQKRTPKQRKRQNTIQSKRMKRR